MGEEVLSPGDAWRAYRALRADRRIGYLSEPAELQESWDLFIPKVANSPAGQAVEVVKLVIE